MNLNIKTVSDLPKKGQQIDDKTNLNTYIHTHFLLSCWPPLALQVLAKATILRYNGINKVWLQNCRWVCITFTGNPRGKMGKTGNWRRSGETSSGCSMGLSTTLTAITLSSNGAKESLKTLGINLNQDDCPLDVYSCILNIHSHVYCQT